MIANEKQYQITKRKLAEFQRQLQDLESASPEYNAVLHQIYINSTKAKIDDFFSELHEYESLKKGEVNNLHLSSLSNISEVLIKARIARGLTQANLADILKIKEQQIQRYEASCYSTISWLKLYRVIEALDIRFSPIVACINVPQFDIGDDISADQVLRAQEALEKRKNILIH